MNATAVVRAIEDALAECVRKRHSVEALVMGKEALDAVARPVDWVTRAEDGSLLYGTIPFKPGVEWLTEWHGFPVVSAVHAGGVVQALIRSVP